MSVGAAIAIVVIVAVAAGGHTVAGFGFSLLAVPLLGLVIGAKDAVVAASVLLVLTSGLLAWGERDEIDWDAARPLLVGAVPGLFMGLAVFEIIPVDLLRSILIATALATVAMIGRGVRIIRRGPLDLLAGVVTGILTTTVNANGPPTVLALQARGLEPSVFRPTTSAVLGLASASGATMFLAGGRMVDDALNAAALGVPAVVIGWALGARLQRRVPVAVFGRVVQLLLVAVAFVAFGSIVA